MAKRGGFQGGMPGNMNNLLKQAQRMQNQMAESKARLDEQEFTAQAGGGAVKVTLLGNRTLKAIELDKDAVDPDDVETLQDMIIAAVNEGMKQIDDASQQMFGGMTGGLGF